MQGRAQVQVQGRARVQVQGQARVQVQGQARVQATPAKAAQDLISPLRRRLHHHSQ